MDNKTKKALLIACLSMIVIIGGISFVVVTKHANRGSYEFAAVPTQPQSPSQSGETATTERAIPVAPGPATPGPETLAPEAADNGEQAKVGVPVIVNGKPNAEPQTQLPTGTTGVNRTLAMTPDGGIANNPHGVDHHSTTDGVPVIVGTPSGGAPSGESAPSAGSATAPGTASPTKDQGAPKTEAEKEPEPTCFTFTYKHKITAGHDSEESCSHHKNLIHLAHKNVNPASLCVRVNGKPVHFSTAKGAPDNIVIGAVAGPKTLITASYCTGTVKCSQTCRVPKDDFLDAIGASAAEGDEGLAMGQWQAQGGEQDKQLEKQKDAKLVGDMKRELSAIDGAEGTGDGYTLFQGWIADAGSPSCNDPTAKAPESGEPGTQVARLSRHKKEE